jgi:hypothetical protein
MEVNKIALYRMARALLHNQIAVTRESIEKAVDIVIAVAPEVATREQLIRELESDFSVSISDGLIISDDTGHISWLPAKRSSHSWDFWKRYYTYLKDQKNFPEEVVNKLDVLTDQVLERIEDPTRPGIWDRRGLVVGQVQSGKTSHYTGVICKAVDAGYKFIVVLAGVHNSLRSQTQLRLDEGFLGVDSQIERAWKKNSNKIGAGLVSQQQLHVAYLTNSTEKGDFKKTVANQIGIPLGSQIPILLVVKKNVGVLKNLVTWLENQSTARDELGNPLLTDFPILVLDDEADFASINPNKSNNDSNGQLLSQQDVTSTNARIRQLLRMFTRSIYVGYTATPFANIFIHPDANADTTTLLKAQGQTTEVLIGQDLFPKHFILNLPAPSNYIGPIQVFGLESNFDGSNHKAPLPIIRDIDTFDTTVTAEKTSDHIAKFREKHDKSLTLVDLPPSLKHAIKAFVLTCAARAARGQSSEHNSMLIHVTRFVAVQDTLAELVNLELKKIQNRLLFGDGSRTDNILTELNLIWKSDFEPTSVAVASQLEDPRIELLNWSQLLPYLKNAASKITVKKINGTAQDILDYYGNPNGISVIAVGGDKLSRGLTLDGLSISYYLRASKMYDTLMQMGRWFGYRPGYADLCRLYTTEELIKWYKHITIASEELRSDFDDMVKFGQTPAEFGLKVRTHTGVMAITGAGKLRNGTRMQVSFSGRLMQSYIISSEPNHRTQNYQLVTNLVNNLKLPSKSKINHHIWSDTPSKVVIDFLQNLVGFPKTVDFTPTRIADFISNLNDDSELTNWTISLMNIGTKDITIANLPVGYSNRTLTLDKKSMKHVEASNRAFVSPDHEYLDLSENQKQLALQLWLESSEYQLWKKDNPDKSIPKYPTSGKWARKVRSNSIGMLLLYVFNPKQDGLEDSACQTPFVGFAVSFPVSELGEKRAVSYIVNSVYAQEEGEDY